ncbi:MAG: MFS transporter [Gammaproteobacteria bacterium]|nr:MFS transporter [Gammaproteobacteria bacterium]
MSLRDRFATRSWYKWYVVGVLTAVYASSQVDRQIMGMLLEPIKLELGASDTQMGFLIGLTFAVFYATLGMPIAMLADRSNRRNIITAAISIWSLMTVVCGYAANFMQLALARIGVGVGEAGSSPPSHSIIADLFGPEHRGTAMGVFALGVNIGLLIAYLAGGWLTENWGWRATFVAVGLPGLLFAAILYFTTREPERGASEQLQSDTDNPPSFAVVARHMWSVRSIRHVVIGSSLAGFVGYGFVLWMPSFLLRSHGLSPTEIGLVLALMTGVVGGLGTFTAGRLADALAKRDIRWRVWVVAAGKAGYVPFLAGVFLVDELWQALLLYVIPAFFAGFYLAPTFALIQGLVSLRMRALASSITLFVLNIIGLGFGPQVVGIMSDMFEPSYGQESLRMALLVLTFINLWCAFHYLIAAKTLKADLEGPSPLDRENALGSRP